MADLRKEFATDKVLEEEGRWVDFDDCEFLIARIGNEKFQKAYRNLGRNVQRQIDQGRITTAKARDIIGGLVAKTILLGWRGNVRNAGKVVGDYTEAKAKELLVELDDFRQWVWEEADDMRAYQAKELEEDVKK